MSPTPETDTNMADLTKTADSPPKKMKQARLPFGPVNTKVTKDAPDSGRKRKLSEELLTPNKNLKKDPEISDNDPEEEVVILNSNSKENKPVEAENVSADNSEKDSVKESKRKVRENVKPKKVKETSEGRSDKFYGLLKMPFKKGDKKESNPETQDDENSIELDAEVIGKDVVTEATAEETSMTSMTEEWARFHESGGDETEVEVEQKNTPKAKTPRSAKKSKEEKEKEKLEREKLKEEKERKKVEEKQRKEEEKKKKEEERVKAKADKEMKKSQEMEEKKSREQEEKEKDEASQEPENEPIVKPVKESPLARFLVKSKPGVNDTVTKAEVKSEEKFSKEDDEVVIVEEKKASPIFKTPKDSSTPLRKSPRKSMGISRTSTPTSSPFDPDRVRQVALAKMRVKISELNIAMDKAVEEKDFLAAHEAKQTIIKLEEQIEEKEKEALDTSYVSQSLVTTLPLEEKEASSAEPTTDTKPATITPVKTNGSAVSTPIRTNVSVVSTPGSAVVTPKASKLTPGQKAKKEESLKKKEALEKEKKDKKEALEKEKQLKKEALLKEKEEKEKQRLDEKAKKDHQKEVEKRAKEVERMEKERIKKAKDQEKEEERLKKKAEKEAELKQKEEEKIKIEEEKKAQEEAEKEKAKKKALMFKNFFTKDDEKAAEKEDSADVDDGFFTQFRLKANMRLAPLVRGDTSRAKAQIDALDMPSGPSGMYLALLKTEGYQPGTQNRTWPYERKDADDDVQVIEEDDDEEEESDGGDFILSQSREKPSIPRAKLLKFHENQRPAYWGTWTKVSKFVHARRPFGRDDERFDYDYESDDDWEEEEQGESLSDAEGDEKEEKEAGEDDYEVDNEFFVPHGYLSDEEEVRDEDEVFNPETAKEKLKLKEKEFEAENKKKTKHLKPRLWGVCYEGQELDTGAAACQLVRILGGYSAIQIGDNNNGSIDTGFSKSVSAGSSPGAEDDGPESARMKGGKGRPGKIVPEEAMPHLIRLLHGNMNNKMFLAREFIQFWATRGAGESNEQVVESIGSTPASQTLGQAISKRKMIEKILEVAEYKRLVEGSPKCWVVKDEVLSTLTNPPPTINSWDYILDPPCTATMTPGGSRPGSPTGRAAPTASPNPASLITKFAKVLSAEEREEQRIRQEKEAADLREKREAKRLLAEQAKAAEVEAKRLLAEQTKSAETVLPVTNSPAPSAGITKFTKVLTSEERAQGLMANSTKITGPIAVLSANATTPKGTKRKSSTPKMASPIAIKRVSSGKKTSTPSPMAIKKDLTPKPEVDPSPNVVKKTSSAKKTPKPSPIAVRKDLKITPDSAKKTLDILTKKTPSTKTVASPIAVKRKPNVVALASLKGITVTKASTPPSRASPRKKGADVACITID